MPFRRRALALFPLALTLAACGSDRESESTAPTGAEEEAEADEPTTPAGPMPQGDFTATGEKGAVYTVHVPAQVPADIADYAKQCGITTLGCVSIDTDNSKGTDTAGPSDVILVGADGKQIDYGSASIVLGDWGPELHEDGSYTIKSTGKPIDTEAGRKLYGVGVDIYNKYLSDPLQVGAKATTFYLGTEAVPEKLASVSVQDALQTYPATPA